MLSNLFLECEIGHGGIDVVLDTVNDMFLFGYAIGIPSLIDAPVGGGDGTGLSNNKVNIVMMGCPRVPNRLTSVKGLSTGQDKDGQGRIGRGPWQGKDGGW